MLAIIDTLSQAGEIKESGLEIGVIMSKKVSVISFYYITAPQEQRNLLLSLNS